MWIQCLDGKHDEVRSSGRRISHVDHRIAKPGKNPRTDRCQHPVASVDWKHRRHHVHNYGCDNDRPNRTNKKVFSQNPEADDRHRNI